MHGPRQRYGADIAAANTARELPASRKCNSSRIREGKFMRVSLSLIPDESYIRYLVYQVSGIWYVSGIRYQGEPGGAGAPTIGR